MVYKYGKVLESVSCGVDVYIHTTKGVYLVEAGTKGVTVTKDKDLVANHILRPMGEWPFSKEKG
jgi:hypothetical protein